MGSPNRTILTAGMTGSVTPAQFLGEMVDPLGRALTPASARAILAIRTSEVSRRRIADLASRCNEGDLSPEEKAEYQLMVEVGDVMALLQARARSYLDEHPA